MRNRQKIIQAIKKDPKTTVLVIGAGINGIGTFRDLALQGINCLIIEKKDFCSGASMASSHMLHGGIRYLENGEFRLVREALHERNNLLRNAPHLTKPLPTTIPIFKWFSGILNSPLKFLGLLDKPAERGAIIIKLGLIMYDAYVRGDSPMPGHRIDNRQKALDKWPKLNPEILFAATYYDGAMKSPERLALDILLDGVNEGDHARALNYVSAAGSKGKNLILRDEISGEDFSIQPQIVINAGGPWIDHINHEISQKTAFIGGTKGSHLIVDHPELFQAIGNHEIFFEYVDGRIVLIFPYLENLVMIGSTDLRIEDPDKAVCTDEEIEYILGMVPQIFPSLKVSKEQIIFQFTGVRPLPRAKGSTGQISRDHSIEILERGDQNPWPILNLVGGKWTSYRALSEQVTDKVLGLFGKPRKASTRQIPIGGGKDYPGDEKSKSDWVLQQTEKYPLPQERVQQLLDRYGTRADEIIKLEADQTAQYLNHLPDFSKQEIIFLAGEEMIVHLDDFFLRRTKLAWTGKVTQKAITEVAGILRAVLKWDQTKLQEEIDRLVQILRTQHAVSI